MNASVSWARLFSGFCLLAFALAVAFLGWEVRQTRLAVGRQIEALHARIAQSEAAVTRKVRQVEDRLDRTLDSAARTAQKAGDAGAKVRDSLGQAEEMAARAQSAYEKTREMAGKARDLVNPPPPAGKAEPSQEPP